MLFGHTIYMVYDCKYNQLSRHTCIDIKICYIYLGERDIVLVILVLKALLIK